jgi:hypothetical protein
MVLSLVWVGQNFEILQSLPSVSSGSSGIRFMGAAKRTRRGGSKSFKLRVGPVYSGRETHRGAREFR